MLSIRDGSIYQLEITSVHVFRLKIHVKKLDTKRELIKIIKRENINENTIKIIF